MAKPNRDELTTATVEIFFEGSFKNGVLHEKEKYIIKNDVTFFLKMDQNSSGFNFVSDRVPKAIMLMD
jgi:hypothetical protein